MKYTITQIKGGTDNCYIVADREKAILVDTASKANLDMVMAECDKYIHSKKPKNGHIRKK